MGADVRLSRQGEQKSELDVLEASVLCEMWSRGDRS